jgi:hypothetical protein
VNAVIQALWNLVVDLPAKTRQAAEGRLDMAARAAEPVIEIEVPEGGVEVVTPHQTHNAAAEPDAFRVPGRAIEDLLRLDEFIGLALIILGRVGRIGSRRLGGLIWGGVAALGERASDPDQQRKPGNGEVAQNRILELKHTSTHKFPDCFLPAASLDRWFDDVQIGPQCGGDAAGIP